MPICLCIYSCPLIASTIFFIESKRNFKQKKGKKETETKERGGGGRRKDKILCILKKKMKLASFILLLLGVGFATAGSPSHFLTWIVTYSTIYPFPFVHPQQV